METIRPLFISFFALSIFFLIHLITWQFNIKTKGVTILSIIALFSFLLIMTCKGLHFNMNLKEYIWGTLSFYMFLIILYLHFYLGIFRSVSVRILGELIHTKEGKLNLKDLENTYSKQYMIESRISLLVKNDWLRKQGDKYICSTKGRLIAALVIFLKRLYALEMTG